MANPFGKLVDGDFTDTHTLCVYRDVEWEEYVAVVYHKCEGSSPRKPGPVLSTYHCEDKEEAASTGRIMLGQATKYKVTAALDPKYW